jgi:serine/threonine protein kinase
MLFSCFVDDLVDSLNWMAPERLLGGPVKKSGDMYALAMLLYEVRVA